MIRQSARSKRLVAVVTPVVKFPLSADEAVSMRHLREYLGGFDRYIIGPQKLPKEFSDFALRRFPARYFTNRYGYNRLLMTKEFYRAFAAYDYILIYQLDCLVFTSNLEEWCRKGWDYVGAPWLINADDPTQGFSGVGNGGLSLRRVKRALAVLSSKHLVADPKVRGGEAGRSRFISERLDSASWLKRAIGWGKTLLHSYGYHNNVRWLGQKLADIEFHEDYFWALKAPRFVSEFRIPAPCEALGFSFEKAPRYCFDKNSGRLPFGCHAWTTYDREFWEPFLLK
jgi:hypothetical protein